jgi:hypothetical protein
MFFWKNKSLEKEASARLLQLQKLLIFLNKRAPSYHIMSFFFFKLLEIPIFRQLVLACGPNISQFLNIFTFLLTCSQIWLILLVYDQQPTYITNLNNNNNNNK